jgi:hypothetical protein
VSLHAPRTHLPAGERQENGAQSGNGVFKVDVPSVSRIQGSDSDAYFLAKLAVLSFAGDSRIHLQFFFAMLTSGQQAHHSWCCDAGAATVKYGSLLIDIPFEPNLPLALALIVTPCAVYSATLINK